MSAQPNRAPEPEGPDAPREVPQLRSHARPRAATAADQPAADQVSHLQDRVAQAFTAPTRGRVTDAVIKLLIVAATCLCMGQALLRDAPLLAHLLG